MDLDSTLAIALVVTAAAGLIYGTTGFGFALISVPILLLVYDPATVVMLTFALTISSCIMVISTTRRSIDVRVVAQMTPGILVGLVAGSFILLIMTAAVIKILAGISVLFFSIMMLRGIRIRGMHHRLAPLVSGGLGGFMGTSTGLSSPPAVIFFSERGYPKDAFRGNMSSYFLFANIVGLIVMAIQGLLTTDQFLLAAALLPGTIIGGLTGAWISRFIPMRIFRRLTLGLLFLTGLMGVITATTALV